MSVFYYDTELRIFVEENIIQKNLIPFKGVCSYIPYYWVAEDGKVAEGKRLTENDELQQRDQSRVK